VPSKVTKEQLLTILGVDEACFKRIYKQSLYWTLISDNAQFNSSFENVLKNIKFDDGKVLRYEITTSKQLTKQINKKLQSLAYQKETNELKAGSNNASIRKDSNKDQLSANSTDAFSWRRKSEYSSSSKDE
jgi:hypothetical protein